MAGRRPRRALPQLRQPRRGGGNRARRVRSRRPRGEHSTATRVLPALLAALHDHELAATFFVEGLNAELYPDALAAIAAGGHEVAYHAWRHETWGELHGRRAGGEPGPRPHRLPRPRWRHRNRAHGHGSRAHGHAPTRRPARRRRPRRPARGRPALLLARGGGRGSRGRHRPAPLPVAPRRRHLRPAAARPGPRADEPARPTRSSQALSSPTWKGRSSDSPTRAASPRSSSTSSCSTGWATTD